MKHIKLFIWDFDGTLVDSYPYSVSCMQRALADFGHEASYFEVLEQMMDTIGVAIRYFTDKYEIPDFGERFWEYHRTGQRPPTVVFDGIPEVLQRIEELGGINLIFSNRNESIYPLLEEAGLRDRFTEIVTTEHPSFAWKPAPDAIEYLMETYGDETAWTTKSLLNIAGSGFFAADRSIRDYAENIWHTKEVKSK